MNKVKITDYDYIDFLIGTQKVYVIAEAERVQPDTEGTPARDAFTRQLNRLLPSAARLWAEVQRYVNLIKGCLIGDDTTLEKFYSRKIEMIISIISQENI